MKPNSNSPAQIQQNIDSIAKLEHEFLKERSHAERLGDAIADFIGSISFVVIHIIWFSSWFLINRRLIPGIAAFDPYPFVFLSMIVSLEAVFLSTFVLMKQNRMSRRADQRSQLDLQINILAEREATMNLQMLQRLCVHLGMQGEADNQEIQELIQTTEIESLAEDLKNNIPNH